MSRHARAARAFAVIGAVTAISSGCLVGPDYQRPALTPPAAIRGGEEAPTALPSEEGRAETTSFGR